MAKKPVATKSKANSKEKTQSRTVPKEETKRVYFKQSDFPLCTLQQTQKIAVALNDNFAADSASPPDVALAMGISPTSSAWPTLTGSAIAYGISEGGVNANRIQLTALGKQLVAPEEEGQDLNARREAILKPRILREFFEKYKRAKFPNEIIAANVLKSLGLPKDRIESAVEIVKSNGFYAGIIRDTPTGPFVNLDSPIIPVPTASHDDSTEGNSHIQPVTVEKETSSFNHIRSQEDEKQESQPRKDPKSNKVFITHGKQRAIVGQIKELLTFGNFEPVVSIERESTAIPVPEKVFEDMRSCSAGVLHVGAEGKYLDKEGNEHTKINDNVLIEIGAAMALYGKRMILLVEKGVTLPSNLQGLYRCEFEGDKLDYDSTMKLLKTFNQFR